MEFLIACECGQSITVSEGKAGSRVQCSCGRLTPVPSLSALRSQGVVKSEPEVVPSGRRAGIRRSLGIIDIAILVGVVVGGSFLAFAFGHLMEFGLFLFVSGHIRIMVLIVRECPPGAAVYALVNPFFSWRFAVVRWDVSKWPLLISTGGFLLALLGASGAGR